MKLSTGRHASIAALACFAGVVLSVPPFVQSYDRDRRWQQDLQVATKVAELDKPLEDAAKRKLYTEAILRLASDVPRLSDEQIIVGLMRALAITGDSHTSLRFGDAYVMHFFRVRFGIFEEGVYVTEAAVGNEQLLGARLLKIADTPVADVLAKLAEILPHENESLLKASGVAPWFMRCAEVLKGLGVITDPTQATYVFQLADGSIRAVDLPSFSTPTEWKTVYTTQLRYADTGHNYWFRALPDSRAIYFQYRRCAQMADLPFATFQQRLLAALDSERSQRLVIDLRDNGGGNSAIADPLIEELATRVAANRLKIYVLIGRGTFSSAALNAISLKLKAHALFVGEPSGAKPNHFGELKSVQLPNSHLYIFYSTRYWRPWPNDHDASLNPDISVAERWQDLAAGKDAALNASLNDAP